MVEWRNVEIYNSWWKNSEQYERIDQDLAPLHAVYGGLDRTSICSLFEPGSIHFIKGPRRVGKTVYLKKLVKELIAKKLGEQSATFDPRAIFFYSAEAKTAKELINTLQTYFDLHYGHSHYIIMIDEVTSIKEVDGKRGWASNLKSLHDSGKFKNTTLVLTGSDANLLEQGRKVLLGRGKAEENLHFLLPMTFRDFISSTLSNARYKEEIVYIMNPAAKQNSMLRDVETKALDGLLSILNQNGSVDPSNIEIEMMLKTYGRFSAFFDLIAHLFSIYILTSGFPQSISQHIMQKNSNSVILYQTLISEILKNLELSNLSSISAEQILIKLAERQGKTVSYNSLAKEIGISSPTVERYVKILENLHLLVIIHDYKPGIKTNLKKIYITDSLLFYLLVSKAKSLPVHTVIEETISKETEMAKIIESLIGNSLFLSMEKYFEDNINLYFKSSKKDKEIDFLFITKHNKKIGIEVKYQNEITKGDIPWHPGVDYYLLITKNTFQKLSENVLAVPASLFLVSVSKSQLFL